MKMRILYTLAAVLLLNIGNAQQTQLSSLYFNNQILVNPAETGYNDITEIGLSYRKQWSGITGTPSTSWLSGHTALNDRMGLGGVVLFDDMSFIQTIDVKLNYAYHLRLARDLKLSFGLGAGVQQSSIDYSAIIADDYSDEILASADVSGLVFDAQFGGLITFQELKIGFNIPQLMQPRFEQSSSTFETNYDLRSHLNLYLNYKFEINKSISLLPTLFYRKTDASGQMDIFANTLINDNLMLGVGYRGDVGLLANVGFNIKNKFQINYAYDFGQSGFGNGTGGSHEVMLKLKINKKAEEPNEEEEKENLGE